MVRTAVNELRDEDRFPFIDEPFAYFTVDAAFVELLGTVTSGDLDARLRLVDSENVRFSTRKLGVPFDLDLDSMEPIGRNVVSVGRTMATQSRPMCRKTASRSRRNRQAVSQAV